MFLTGFELLLVVGLYQLVKPRNEKRSIQKIEINASNQRDANGDSFITKFSIRLIKIQAELFPENKHRGDQGDLMQILLWATIQSLLTCPSIFHFEGN